MKQKTKQKSGTIDQLKGRVKKEKDPEQQEHRLTDAEVVPYRRERMGIVCTCPGCLPGRSQLIPGEEGIHRKLCRNLLECKTCGWNSSVRQSRIVWLQEKGLTTLNGKLAFIVTTLSNRASDNTHTT